MRNPFAESDNDQVFEAILLFTRWQLKMAKGFGGARAKATLLGSSRGAQVMRGKRAPTSVANAVA